MWCSGVNIVDSRAKSQGSGAMIGSSWAKILCSGAIIRGSRAKSQGSGAEIGV